MHLLTLEEILLLHFKIIEDFGGSHGVRNENSLRSVMQSPAQEVFGQKLYPLNFDKAAVYIRSIIGDHPFSDGNKRTAITVGVIYLKRSGREMTASPRELEDFAVQVATDHLDVPYIAAWLKAHSRQVYDAS